MSRGLTLGFGQQPITLTASPGRYGYIYSPGNQVTSTGHSSFSLPASNGAFSYTGSGATLTEAGGTGTPAYFNNFDALTNGSSAPFNTFNFATVSNAQSFDSPNSVVSTVAKNSDSFGGGYALPTSINPTVGAEVWFRIRLFFPTGFNFTAKGGGSATALKFMRIDTSPTSAATDHSHIDWYLFDGNATSVGTFDWIYEGSPSGGPGNLGWLFGGGGGTPIPSGIIRNQWQTWEVYYKLETTGAASIIRFWRDGTLLCDTSANIPSGVPQLPTIISGNSIYGAFGNPGGFMWSTYWNGGSPAAQSAYCDDFTIFTSLTGRPTATDSHGNTFIGTGAP
jgi:hypothetical protein